VHAVVDGDVEAADFVHDGLRDDHVGERAAAARALQEVDLVQDTTRVENWEQSGRAAELEQNAVVRWRENAVVRWRVRGTRL
jgi:hypothetical protein